MDTRGEGWQTGVGLRHTTEITRLTLDERSQAVDAALTIIQAYKAEHDGEVLVVDASARDRSLEWSSALSSIGMTWHPGTSAMNQQPLHHAVVRAASLAQGMSSWSLSSLRSVFFSATIPLLDDAFPGLNHPTEGVWRPRPDAVVLRKSQEISTFLGAGAIARWLGVLSSAEPSFAERRPEEKARALEETQWWLACLCTHGPRCFHLKTGICSNTPSWVAPQAPPFRCPILHHRAWAGSHGLSPPSMWVLCSIVVHLLMQVWAPFKDLLKP